MEGRPLDTLELTRSSWLTIAGIPARIELLDRISAEAWQQEIDTRRVTLRRLGQRLDASLEPSALFERILDGFATLSECPHVALLLADERGRTAQVQARGASGLTPSEGVVARVMRSGEPVVTSDISTQRALADRQSIASGGIRAMACLPLKLAGEVRGVLYASSRETGKTFTTLDLELLEGLARQAAFTVALTRMRTELERLQVAMPSSPDALESSRQLAALLERVMPAVDP